MYTPRYPHTKKPTNDGSISTGRTMLYPMRAWPVAGRRSGPLYLLGARCSQHSLASMGNTFGILILAAIEQLL